MWCVLLSPVLVPTYIVYRIFMAVRPAQLQLSSPLPARTVYAATLADKSALRPWTYSYGSQDRWHVIESRCRASELDAYCRSRWMQGVRRVKPPVDRFIFRRQ